MKENRVRAELNENDFPKKFIEKAYRARKKQEALLRTGTAVESGSMTAVIPYVQGMTEAIVRVMRQVNVRTVLMSKKQKWNLMKGVKDILPPQTLSGVVCALCFMDRQRIYIGETKRTAKKQMEEHQAHVKKKETRTCWLSRIMLFTLNTAFIGHCELSDMK